MSKNTVFKLKQSESAKRKLDSVTTELSNLKKPRSNVQESVIVFRELHGKSAEGPLLAIAIFNGFPVKSIINEHGFPMNFYVKMDSLRESEHGFITTDNLLCYMRQNDYDEVNSTDLSRFLTFSKRELSEFRLKDQMCGVTIVTMMGHHLINADKFPGNPVPSEASLRLEELNNTCHNLRHLIEAECTESVTTAKYFTTWQKKIEYRFVHQTRVIQKSLLSMLGNLVTLTDVYRPAPYNTNESSKTMITRSGEPGELIEEDPNAKKTVQQTKSNEVKYSTKWPF